MVALSPALLLSSYINWDLLAVALAALALAAWSARRPALAGVLLGLAIAAKFYPLLFLGPAGPAVRARRAVARVRDGCSRAPRRAGSWSTSP